MGSEEVVVEVDDIELAAGVQVDPPLLEYWTTYEVIRLPPVVGAVQDKEAELPLAVAIRAVGAPGTAEGSGHRDGVASTTSGISTHTLVVTLLEELTA